MLEKLSAKQELNCIKICLLRKILHVIKTTQEYIPNKKKTKIQAHTLTPLKYAFGDVLYIYLYHVSDQSCK